MAASPCAFEAGDDQVPVLDEAVEEDAAPGLGRLLVLGRDDGDRNRLLSPHCCLLHGPMVRLRGPAVTHPGVIRASIVALAVSALLGVSPASSDAPSPYQAAVHLSGKIGSRPSASPNERRAHRYVAHQFRAAGLDVQVDPFRVPGRGRSRNVIGKLDRPGKLPGRS